MPKFIKEKAYMGKIVAFANQKGGVGKTTTCVNMSAYLAYMGKKVLLVDMDPQGNASSGLGIDKTEDIYTLYDVIDQSINVKEAILKTKIPGLDIIPATVDLAGGEMLLAKINDREIIVKKALDKLSDNYDYICIDCPPSLALLTINALTACNSVVIPIQCEFYALEGLAQLMNTIKLIKKHLNNSISIEGVVLTMKDNRSNLVNEVSAEIHKFFGKKVFQTTIPRNIKLAEAPSHGEPIILYDRTSKGAISYQELTEEFLTRNKDTYIKITNKTKII